MNNLKFRAWVEDHFVYSTDDPGYEDGDAWFGFEKGILKAWVHETVIPDDIHEPPYGSAEEVESPIEQFTGLLDKNGVEIYEGDVVEAFIYADESPQIFPVYETEGAFVIDYKDSETDMALLGWFAGSIKVIGNIHSDPELLK